MYNKGVNIWGILFIAALSATVAVLALSSVESVEPDVSTPQAPDYLETGPQTSDAVSPNGWVPIVGASLINSAGSAVPTDSLNTEYLAIYFSASWCPPCRLALPRIKKFYNSYSDQVTIVFAGMDQTPESRSRYYLATEMPWLSLPFESSTAESLAERLKVRGIPAVFVFDRAGEMVTGTALRDITSQPDAALSKWGAK